MAKPKGKARIAKAYEPEDEQELGNLEGVTAGPDEPVGRPRTRWESEPKKEYAPYRVPEQTGRISKPVAIAVSVVLALCIMVLIYLFVSGMKEAFRGQAGAGPAYSSGYASELPELPNMTQPVSTQPGAECVKSYGMDPKALVFAYKPTCSACEQMVPIVISLESRGYKFNWVDRDNTTNNLMLSKCLKGAVAGVVPQFICPNNFAQRTGAIKEGEIAALAEECKNS